MNEHPMPGPPECLPSGFPHEGAVINAPGCLLHARSYHANSKRLKNDECDAHYRQPFNYRTLDWTTGSHLSPSIWKREIRESDTWKRFATRPHALEDTND